MAYEEEQMLRAGWLHLVEGLTQDAVARRLGVTRMKANRLVAACRASGRLHVGLDVGARFCFGREQALVRRYGLDDAYVVPTPADPARLAQAIGVAAGAYVSAVLGKGETLALGWGRTLDASTLGLVPRPPLDNVVITLMGGIAVSGPTNPYDLSSRYARTLSAGCRYLVAPMLADSPDGAAMLMALGAVREVLRQTAAADVALFGVDGLHERASVVEAGLLTWDECRALRARGAVGNAFGLQIDETGAVLDDPVNARRVGLGLDGILGIPRRLVAAGGPPKLAVLRAVLARGLCTALVTDEETAAALIA